MLFKENLVLKALKIRLASFIVYANSLGSWSDGKKVYVALKFMYSYVCTYVICYVLELCFL
jgi:hypothetical protein